MKCYYEELELECTASVEEITKAYKKFALKYHPDKNVGNAEEASNKFLDIQKAYKVLRDPHERAWYDRNKDAIEVEELSGNFVNPTSYHNTYAFKNYDDNRDGFYTVYRELFQAIVSEELLFDKTKTEDDYPIFGYSDSNFESVVKPFYLRWCIFQTKKTFSWTDDISEQEGMNRQEVRYIKKLNSKNRNIQVKQYNESVRSLVLFLKKRDQRIPKKPAAPPPSNPLQKPPTHIKRAPIDIDWQAHYQNILGDLDEIDNQIDDFIDGAHKQKPNRDFDGIDDEQIKLTLEQHSGFVFKDDDDDESPAIRCIKCILCDKDFKSLAMFLSHIKSKKHLTNVKACERAKKKQQYINDNFFTPPVSDVEIDDKIEHSSSDVVHQQDEIPIETNNDDNNDNNNNNYDEDTNIEQSSNEINGNSEQVDDVCQIQQSFESIKIKPPKSVHFNDNIDDDQVITKEDLSKVKRKNKSNKKKKPPQNSTTVFAKKEFGPTNININAEENDAETNEYEFECQICGKKYPSNSKLFNHIKEKGHAALKTGDTTKSKKKPKKKI